MSFSQELLVRFQSSLAQKKQNFAFYETHVEIFPIVVAVVRYLVLNLATTLEMALQSPQEGIRLGLSTLAEAVLQLDMAAPSYWRIMC